MLSENFHIKNNLMWEQTRYLACMVYNMNITKRSQSKKPQQLFKLPQDHEQAKAKEKIYTHDEMIKFKDEVEKLQSESKFKEVK